MSPFAGKENRFALTHMSHAVRTAASAAERESAAFPETLSERYTGGQLAVAAGVPSPLAAVAKLPALDDVDDAREEQHRYQEEEEGDDQRAW